VRWPSLLRYGCAGVDCGRDSSGASALKRNMRPAEPRGRKARPRDPKNSQMSGSASPGLDRLLPMCRRRLPFCPRAIYSVKMQSG
jgi:hypothetical protein